MNPAALNNPKPLHMRQARPVILKMRIKPLSNNNSNNKLRAYLVLPPHTKSN